MITIPESNTSNKYEIFNLVSSPSYFAYKIPEWHGTAKSESENLLGNIVFKFFERINNVEVEKVGRKYSVIWNHKYFNLIHVDLNNARSNQPIPTNEKNSDQSMMMICMQQKKYF